ncbi:hypothetical protein [Nocardia sp. XZ_19_369]|uniref:hypothetical protein n=1 Tax=Nocardia sp. XZ_19_369 TaxID=2769487 RepID=UPI0018909F3C|nr:hypothetical protein [Nocardia sp. XZ_19_369]
MSAFIGAAAQFGGWVIVWLQLPLLVIAAAILVGSVIALIRARPEDIPSVFGMLTTGFGRWPEWFRRDSAHEHESSAQPKNEPLQETAKEEG